MGFLEMEFELNFGHHVGFWALHDAPMPLPCISIMHGNPSNNVFVDLLDYFCIISVSLVFQHAEFISIFINEF